MQPQTVEEELVRVAEAVSGLRRELETRLDESDKALILQAVEVERRLQLLNNSHELAAHKDATYVTRDEFKASVDSVREKADLVAVATIKQEAALSALDTSLNALSTSMGWLTRLVVGAVVTAMTTGLIALLLQFFFRR